MPLVGAEAKVFVIERPDERTSAHDPRHAVHRERAVRALRKAQERLTAWSSRRRSGRGLQSPYSFLSDHATFYIPTPTPYIEDRGGHPRR